MLNELFLFAREENDYERFIHADMRKKIEVQNLFYELYFPRTMTENEKNTPPKKNGKLKGENPILARVKTRFNIWNSNTQPDKSNQNDWCSD